MVQPVGPQLVAQVQKPERQVPAPQLPHSCRLPQLSVFEPHSTPAQGSSVGTQTHAPFWQVLLLPAFAEQSGPLAGQFPVASQVTTMFEVHLVEPGLHVPPQAKVAPDFTHQLPLQALLIVQAPALSQVSRVTPSASH